MYSAPSSNPGISAPMKRSPADRLSRSAISTSMIDGGIRMPSVPTAPTVPAARPRSYFSLSIGGSASTASSVTEAATTPVDAASSTPMMQTTIAMPPRMRPKSFTKFCIICSAMPDLSSITPM